MAFETFIALRQLRAGRGGSLSVLTTIAVGGVVLAVAALVTVMSVTGGFQRLFREKVLGLNAHILIMRYGLDFTEYRDVMQRARQVPGVLGASPFIFNEMMISAGDVLGGVMIKGIDPGTVDLVSDLRHYLERGDQVLGSLRRGSVGRPPGIILGREVAEKLGVEAGDAVLLVSPLRGLDPMSFSTRDLAPTSATFIVAGIYRSGFYEYDSRLVFVHYHALQDFFRQADTVTGVELKVDDIFGSRSVAQHVRVQLGDQRYSVASWAGEQVELFRRISERRDRLRWGLLVGVLSLLCAGVSLLVLPGRGHRVARGIAAAMLVTLAGGAAIGAWLSGWGASFLDGPDLGLHPHLRIQRDNGDFLEYRNALAEARAMRQVARVGAFINGEARAILPRSISSQGQSKDLLLRIRGFDSEANTLPLQRFLVRGKIGYLVPPMLPEAKMPPYRVVLGQGLAAALQVDVGDRFGLRPTRGPRGRAMPEIGPYDVEVVALVQTGDPVADAQTLFMDFIAARRILSLIDAAEGIEIWLSDPLEADAVGSQISSRLGGHSYRTLDWKEINHNIFRSLELQKQSLTLVLFVITVVAALNIISTLVLVVIDKGHQVAILKAMGATAAGVLRIFVVQGFLIGLTGTVIGLGVGYLVCKLLSQIRFPLQAEVYLIEYLPVDICVSDFAAAGLAALVVSLWATLYPSIRAASLTPVEGIRDR